MSEIRTSEDICLIAEKESRVSFDEIWVYGSKTQSKLSDFSKTMANAITVSGGDEIERLLNDAIEKLDQSVLQEKRGLFARAKANTTRKYRETLQCIDDVTVNLRLRQAQLLKDIKIFKDMSALISSCVDELEIYIEVGKKRLSDLTIGVDDADWKKRFEGKINELEMSHVIALQSVAQLQLMENNHALLIEKMNNILSNTIPLWRNQAVVAYGIEKYEDTNLTQKKVIAATEKIARKNEKDIKRQMKHLRKSEFKEADIEKIKKINDRLEASLEDLRSVEKDIKGSTEKMDELLWKFNDIDKPIKLTL